MPAKLSTTPSRPQFNQNEAGCGAWEMRSSTRGHPTGRRTRKPGTPRRSRSAKSRRYRASSARATLHEPQHDCGRDPASTSEKNIHVRATGPDVSMQKRQGAQDFKSVPINCHGPCNSMLKTVLPVASKKKSRSLDPSALTQLQ